MGGNANSTIMTPPTAETFKGTRMTPFGKKLYTDTMMKPDRLCTRSDNGLKF